MTPPEHALRRNRPSLWLDDLGDHGMTQSIEMPQLVLIFALVLWAFVRRDRDSL